MQRSSVAALIVLLAASCAVGANAELDFGRRLLQKIFQGTPATITVSPNKTTINAIVITPVIPYPQNAYFCNITGDGGIPQAGPFPLTVRVPVGVTATIVFANITGPIPGTACSAVQQPGSTSVVQQPSTVVQQLVNNPSSVVQQAAAGGSIVQQNYAASINQQATNPGSYFNCVGNTTSIVQQPGSTVVQQPGSTSVVQQPGATSVVQQPGATSVVQQPGSTSVVQQPTTTPAAATVVQQTGSTSVVQQPNTTPAAATVVQQTTPTPSSVVQQPTTPGVSGRHLLQAGTIEYISNNGSTGQPQLSVLDTVEGVPNISFKPDKTGQIAQFNGALQVAVTLTKDGFGTPYIPYQVDAKLSPQCNVQVNFVGV